jgi:hypothetical protein
MDAVTIEFLAERVTFATIILYELSASILTRLTDNLSNNDPLIIVQTI